MAAWDDLTEKDAAFALEASGALMGAFGSVFDYLSTREAGYSAVRRGINLKRAADYEAQQLDISAGQAVGASQRAAAEERRQGELVASRIQALAAASGGGVSDPTVVDLMASASGEAEYRALLAGYEGEEIARVRRMQARGRRYEGASALQLGYDERRAFGRRSISTLIGGFGRAAGDAVSLYTKYGRSTPAP